MKENILETIKKHYEECYIKHGDNCQGADWPNETDLIKRYNIMFSVIRETSLISLLDYGCGTGMFLEHIKKDKKELEYYGVDVNPVLIKRALEKFPSERFWVETDGQLDPRINYDYIICNGVFTEKLSANKEEMFDYLCEKIKMLFSVAKKGIAFNVMSPFVDYEVQNLFYLEHDKLLKFVVKNLTRHYVIRNDYGLYEYTIYLYKETI